MTDDPTIATLRREAAQWRRKLRETEADRDRLATKLAALQQHTISTALRSAGINADKLFRVRALSDLLDRHGDIDVEAIRNAVADIDHNHQVTATSR